MKSLRGNRLSEQFALDDLDANAISSITSEWLFDREHGSGSNRINLEAVRLQGGFLYLHYRAYPTYDKTNVGFDSRGGKRRVAYYDILIQLQDANKEIGDAETFYSFNAAEQSAIVRDYVHNGLARVWCACGAFYYQGMWEDMDSHDSTVFPFTGPPGKGIWTARHSKGLVEPKIRICKHIASAIHHLDSDVGKIVQELQSVSTPNVKQRPRWIVASPREGAPVYYIYADTRNKARNIYSRITGEPYIDTKAIVYKEGIKTPF